MRHRLDAPLDALAGPEQAPGEHGRLAAARTAAQRGRVPACRRAVRDDADLADFDVVAGSEPVSGRGRHRDHRSGLGHDRFEHLALVGASAALRPCAAQRCSGSIRPSSRRQDLVTVMAAVNAVLVLHDRHVAVVEPGYRAMQSGLVPGRDLGDDLTRRPGLRRFDEADDVSFVAAVSHESVAKRGGESGDSTLGWRERADEAEMSAHKRQGLPWDGPDECPSRPHARGCSGSRAACVPTIIDRGRRVEQRPRPRHRTIGTSRIGVELSLRPPAPQDYRRDRSRWRANAPPCQRAGHRRRAEPQRQCIVSNTCMRARRARLDSQDVQARYGQRRRRKGR